MRKTLGFTTVELVVVMAIVAMVAIFGISSYKTTTDRTRIGAEVNGLVTMLQYARTEAFREGSPVTVCVSTNGTSCTGGTAWAGGWIVFSDINGNQAVDTATDTILKVQQPFIGTSIPSPDTFTANNSLTAITFNREGFTSVTASPVTVITLHAATPSSYSTQCLVIGSVGQIVKMTTGQTYNGQSGLCS